MLPLPADMLLPQRKAQETKESLAIAYAAAQAVQERGAKVREAGSASTAVGCLNGGGCLNRPWPPPERGLHG